MIVVAWLDCATAADTVKVRVQPGQTLRDIAQQQLGDPDLWTEILRANGLSSITDVQPGMDLVVPAGEIAAAPGRRRRSRRRGRRDPCPAARR